MSIRVQNLTKQYNQQRAVNQISFSVEPGEIVGFLGPNGAGKSTTMKIATGYIQPTEGTVEVNGFDVRTQPMDVRRSVGYLPEHNPLYLDLYVKEYLRFAGSLHGLRGTALGRRISEMIELVGLGREQHKRIGQLSKGYRQRIGLAQALLHNPPVLILDEPTTGLDPNQLAEIRQVIRDAGRDKTVLFSTHIMQEVEAICDRVIIINRGKLVVDGPLSQLRSASGGGNVVVVAEFEGELQDPALLSTLIGVEQVEPLGAGQYRISARPTTDLRASIFRLAADQNLTLVGLRQQENSLEGIFKELTK
ncbi:MULTISPECIES: gliding motility-associated ABC transporter ATP-binding subunit GldA [unclassified Spirosoma]|uniref:gliding motility-associated ABC transporter ATP-binding subunit GldA n=1 Tax=unclassified Spirosoma TaxID=2621999 RepID=UPI00096220A4|nr:MULTISPECIES: gliding motility-associated ABC transporter ATP-binding subunit GldA [unclassified Spirosoma]MBN8822146.1 gliding motility-associated ABC transporter ATP-binding subunit GldA [Spirosoma sp.]OJW80542.1 MAG: gliding motility-associated ABC transporter ATP-binding subunit GldA [Spirosoma sp. 48-14]